MGRFVDLLRSPGFQSFLWAQFLGALNDNTYKIIVSLFAVATQSNVSGASSHLSLVGAVFIIPFFLFSGYAGYLADVYSKRSVLVATKLLEVVAMGVGILALNSGQFSAMLAVLFLMAVHSTFFSPAKYGILPEMLPDKDLSRANGLLEMTTLLAIVLGTALGSFMFAAWKQQLWITGVCLTAVALVGALASLGIPRVPPSGATKSLQLNPFGEVWSGARRIYSDKTLRLTVFGISYFWFLGTLLQMDIFLIGKEILKLAEFENGLLVTFLAVGIGLGSLIAGRLSGDKVELGLVPLGSIGMGLFSFLLFSSTHSYLRTGVALSLLGFAAGLFIVPLNALLQQRSGHAEKGQLIATNNFVNTAGILLASGVLPLCINVLRIPPDSIAALFGFLTLAATFYSLTVLPDFLIRFSLWMLTHTIYRIRIVGQESVPFRGPALLVCNHISYVDALLIGACVQRFVRFLVYRPIYETRGLQWLFHLMKAIPLAGQSPRALLRSLEAARNELRAGHVVCIFAEGGITRTGNLLPFQRGFEKIVQGTEAPVVPVYLDRVWGSIFSFKNGRFLWKWPERVPYPVTVLFGSPLAPTAKAQEVRQKVLELGSAANEHRRRPYDMLHYRFLKTARRRWFSFCMADSTGTKLSFGRALVGGLLLAQWLKKHCPQDRLIGLFLPASCGGALANIAVHLAGKVSVNLNFTAGREATDSAIEQCQLQTILTSRVFLSKAGLETLPGMVFIEQILREISSQRKILTFAAALLLPARLLHALYNGRQFNPNALATVIFSSGSTGVPKGVMLSHHNLLSNLEAIVQIFSLGYKDCFLGVIPFFHSFGFTVNLWLPLTAGFGAVYHPNPIDAKVIGELARRYKATVLCSTPTFYAAYVRRISAQEFSTLRYAIAGAEKLRAPVAAAFKDIYGLDLLEGYGCTEMGPVISVNLPDVEIGGFRNVGIKLGTVGHPIPGVATMVVDPVTEEPLATGKEGLLLVKGPNRMLGYLGQPEKTAAVFRGDWYVTGDIACIDGDGFITITDRLSRFSKIGGEMVPHVKLEETINEIAGDHACAVTAVPDEQKGERMVVFYTHPQLPPGELWEKLNHTNLPKLWIPKRENLYPTTEIPLLGSGKVDLKKVKALALEKAKEQ